MSPAPFVHPTRGPLPLGRPRVSPRDKKSLRKAMLLQSVLSNPILPDPPEELDLTNGRTDWGVMLNNNLGDCTCAALGHLIQVWTGITVPDSAILSTYEGACGYNPADPNTDQGGIISNVLDYFRDTGVGGHKITAHAEVDITELRVKQAMWMFKGVGIGVVLPISAQEQVGGLWDFVNMAYNPDEQPGTWGGHAIALVKYDPTGVWCVTWGLLQKMSWRWMMYYCDEVQACISPEVQSEVVDSNQLGEKLIAVGH